jgi:Rrf2 family nitric oxide-sensitive transcriptional repressor
MRLTTFTDYSLRTLIYVAGAPSGRCTIAEVARAFDIAETHIVKVAHRLGKLGVLSNSRGRGGGLSLARSPAAIKVGQVARATEGADVLAECFKPDGQCPIDGRCRLERAFGEAAQAFYDALDRYTLADLVSNRRELVRVLHWDAAQPHHTSS